jgi:hypothetical protein
VQTYQEHVWRRADYEKLFAPAPAPAGAVTGEATPFYLHDLAAHERIHRLTPHTKIILVLRDPVDRAHSNWSHLWGAGLESESDFLRAVALEPRRRAVGWAAFWHYTGLGMYGSHYFDRSQVLLLRFRDLRDEPAVTLDRVCAFLGVATGVIDSVPPENVRRYVEDTTANSAVRLLLRTGARFGHHFPPRLRRAASDPLLAMLHRRHGRRPRVTPEQRAALLPRFADDIRKLQVVSGESYADWLSLDHASMYH